MAPSCKLRFARFSARLKFQDRAECGNIISCRYDKLYKQNRSGSITSSKGTAREKYKKEKNMLVLSVELIHMIHGLPVQINNEWKSLPSMGWLRHLTCVMLMTDDNKTKLKEQWKWLGRETASGQQRHYMCMQQSQEEWQGHDAWCNESRKDEVDWDNFLGNNSMFNKLIGMD